MILLAIALILIISGVAVTVRRPATAVGAAYDARVTWLKDRLARQRIYCIASVVNFTYTGYRLSLNQRLALRAIPNQRLADAFGIHNSFTTFDRKVHMNFLKRSSEGVRKAGNQNWLQLFDHACRIVAGYSDVLGKSWDDILLAPMVRKVCLRIVMQHLFDTAVEGTSLDHEYQTVTDQINLQWIASKQSHRENQARRSSELERVLRSIMNHSPLPSEEAEPVQVLELLLPAYETLWRVVVLAFIDFVHRRGAQDDVRRFQLCVTTHIGSGNEQEQEVLKVAMERLRLYPSTKRVYRAVNASSNTDQFSCCGNTISADIEAGHSTEISGVPMHGSSGRSDS
ncbi:hypothetical protein PspLS_01261 [Pyricularia sp. CBS 133598]|nr:hypothetical protein PspLS_01261 [Pyricularia sp. CBS 133598]